jgi:uncharacterized protein (TIGR03790 family)
MRSFRLIVSLLIGCGSSYLSYSATEGDSVVVVYNTRVPESKGIAEHYAQRRNVPKAQIFGFDLPKTESMTRVDYHDGLQNPLLKKLESLKLWRFGTGELLTTNGQPVLVDKVLESKIRYVVLCYGVPYAIARDSNLKEAAEEMMRPEFRRNEAAVDSELAALPNIKQNLPLAGPLHNPQYTTTNEWSLHPTNGVLMVARLDGPSAQIANALVDKAIAAETDGLWGRAYFDVRNTGELSLKVGDDWIRGASEICRHFGFETVVEETGSTFSPSFPMSQIAIYAGWYTENVDGPFTLPNVEFMPGAFAYHLHSFSAAALRTMNRNWTGPLLAKGATISMGTVDEPYLMGTPDIAAFMGRFMFYSFSFGAAAYASQNVLSWQTTVVGDPLYRPFKKSPPQLHKELEAKHSKLIEWSHLKVVDLNLVRNSSMTEVINYLETIPTTKESAVLQEKLGDICAAEGKPSSAIQAYEQALKSGPSPQQRVRLRLTLGEKLSAANRDQDAYANYQKFLEEVPSYPDKLPIFQKLLALSQKLGKNENAEKYEAEIKALVPQGQR